MYSDRNIKWHFSISHTHSQLKSRGYGGCFIINAALSAFITQKKAKKKFNYLKDTEVPTKLDGIIRQMKIWDVDLVALAEVCVAWEEACPRRIIQNITQQYNRTGYWTVASSKLSVGNFIKPGSTGILSMGESNGRVIDRGTDPWGMGRWSYCVLTGGQKKTSLLTITGYRPGRRSGPAEPRTAWLQQQTMLLKDKRSEDPHNAFLTNLANWI